MEDGKQAWEVLSQEDSPNLCILDWMMPGMDGTQVCQKIREGIQEPYKYVVLLTSKTMKEEIVQGLESGADDYLPKPFDANELRVRLRVGKRIINLHSELLVAKEKLREQATHDALTKLYNRGAILEILQREVERVQREGSELGLIMIDLDFFKKINDSYGHLAGDKVLKEGAKRLMNSIRQYDFVGRYGGEEFIVVLPGCDSEQVLTQAERLRVEIAGIPIKIDQGPINVTGSFGAISTCDFPKGDPNHLILEADEALYRAKEGGRNRVELARKKTESLLPDLSPNPSSKKATGKPNVSPPNLGRFL